MAHIFAIANQKGGVGKTTTTVNLSTYLALEGYRVLVIDLDPQGNCSSSFGVSKEELSLHSYHLLVGRASFDEVVHSTEIENLSVIPTNTDLAGAEIELVAELGREYRLQDALKGNLDEYDAVFLDCPPSLGLITLNALATATYLIVPMQCEFFALEGVTQLLQTLELVQARINPNIELAGLVLTMFDRRNKLSFHVADEVRSYFEGQVFETEIPRNVRLSESPSYGQPIALYDARSRGAQAYQALAKEVSNAFWEDA